MLNRKYRQIRTLQARIDKLVEQRDEARRERDAAVWFTGRLAQQDPDAPGPNWEAAAKQIAKDRAEADRAAKWEIQRLEAVIQDWAELSAVGTRRLQRLAQTVLANRRTITEQTATIAGQAERLAKWEGGDRALMPPPRTGADAVAQLIEERRINALLIEQVRGQADQLAILQKANEAKYWRLARRAAAVSATPPALKAAS